jgi:hypothetical protein
LRVKTEQQKQRRNELQRQKRATPEAKEHEARARRRSYWRKKEGWSFASAKTGHSDRRPCALCLRVGQEHDLFTAAEKAELGLA